MIITSLLLLLTPPQMEDGFAEDILRGHRCTYEYFEDTEGLTIEQIRSEEFKDYFLPMDSFPGSKKFKHYWVKIYVPELEENAQYYFQYYVPFDEMALHFAQGPPVTKNWHVVSDTSRFAYGNIYALFDKNDLFEGKYFYLRGYMATYRMDQFAFFIFNKKAAYTFSNNIDSSRFISYHIYNIVYIGAILIIFLYVLVTYFYNRQSVYLYYLLYLFSAGTYLFSRSTFVQDYILPHILSAFPTSGYHIGFTVQYLMHVSYLWFAMSFLNAKTTYPLFHKVGRYMSYFFVMCIGITIISLEFFPKTRLWLSLYEVERYTAILFTIAIQIYIILNKKDKLANFIVVGSIFFVTGAFASIIFWDVYFFRVGTILEIITFSMGLAYRLRQSETAQLSLEREVERVKMIALRTQMKPHFLFNTINSIRALILKGSKEEAYEHLAVFSKLIRYVLESSESELVPLKQELTMLDIYVDMEKRRLSREFNYQQNIEASVNAETTLIPPLILQPFIENAIIHGLAPKEGPKQLNLHIESENHLLKCTVTDNGVGRNGISKQLEPTDKKSMAIGLTEKRISLLAPNKNVENNDYVSIQDLRNENGEPNGTQVEVKLPLILRQ